MAEQNQARMLSAAFPTPPPYYKDFTKQNVARIRQIQKDGASNSGTPNGKDVNGSIDLQSLPAELRNLVPPEPPSDGRYKSFGGEYDLAQPEQSLEAAGIPQLYRDDTSDNEQFDPTAPLQTLTRSILLNFLELVGTLSVNPTQGPQKVEDLQNLFYNAHDLINRYRPHQARESLILMMEEQLDKAKSDVARVKEAKDKMSTLLKGVEALSEVSTSSKTGKDATSDEATQQESYKDMDKATQDSIWRALDEELGG